MSAALVGFIPSPSRGVVEVGPVPLRAYGLLIALGVLVAVSWSNRRYQARTGDASAVPAVATWAVPAGIVGARAYHVATDWRNFRGRWHEALFVWQGGLGIWGAIAAGAAAGYVVARRRGYDVAALLDATAPAIPLAQAIGRWGNWFNQELFGRPTDVPWALEIDPSHRPDGYERFATFHPTFLYESLWLLVVVALVLVAERRRWLRPGRLFPVYVGAYCLGRFFVERLRIDPAYTTVGSFRVNEVVAAVLFLASVALVVAGRRRHEAPSEETVPTP